MNQIPKYIHYCWVGGSQKPVEMINQIDDWKRILSDYQIIEWNEQNFNIENSCPYVREAYEAKKWAFVTDYMRLKILYEKGGIYLDTDVEVKKVFDDLLNYRSFLGGESKYSMCTAVIGARPGELWVKEVLDLYQERHFKLPNGKLDLMPNSVFLFQYFKEHFDHKENSMEQKEYDGCIIFPYDYFSPINYNTMKCNMTNRTYTIHHYNGAWKGNSDKLKAKMLAFVTRIIGEDTREKLKKMLKNRKQRI